MLIFGATAIILIYMAVNKANHWPKACHIPVRYVALFSLQLVVIQPFPLDLFTTTNNNNINISRKMASVHRSRNACCLLGCPSRCLFVCLFLLGRRVYKLHYSKVKDKRREKRTHIHTRAQIMGYSLNEIGRAHVWTPVTHASRMPS